MALRRSAPAKRAAQLLSLVGRAPYVSRELYTQDMQGAIDRLCAKRAFDVIQLESSLLCAFTLPRGPRLILDEHNLESRCTRAPRARALAPAQGVRRDRVGPLAPLRADVVAPRRRLRRHLARARSGSSAPTRPTRRSRSCRTASTSTTSGPTGARPEPDTAVFNGRARLPPEPRRGRTGLVDDIWPRVLRLRPRAPGWRSSGAATRRDLQRLARPGVEVTGEVPEVRPYLARGRRRRRPDPHGRRNAAEGRRGPRDGQGDGLDDAWLRGRRACATASTCSFADDAAGVRRGRRGLFERSGARRAMLGKPDAALMERGVLVGSIAGDPLDALLCARRDPVARRRPVRRRPCDSRWRDAASRPRVVHRPSERHLRAADPARGRSARRRRLRRRGAVHAPCRTRPAREVVNGVAIIGRPDARCARNEAARTLSTTRGSSSLVAGTLAARHLRRPYAVVQVNTMPDFLVFAAARAEAARQPRRRVHERADARAGRDAVRPGRVRRVLARVEQSALRFADHAITVTEQLKQRYVERGAPTASRITVVLNGADPASAWPAAPPPEAGTTTNSS